MKLTFNHRGLQFFFITLTLEGRPQALSEIVEGDKGPETVLTGAGEIVVAFLRAIHAVFPAVTISDRMVMPDHIHFLMIVRYDQSPDFNPLWVSFALMKAIEEAWNRTDGGSAPAPLPSAAPTTSPDPKPEKTAPTNSPELTPEEAARLLAMTVARERAEAAAIEGLMAQGLTRAEALARLSQGRGGAAPVRSVLRFDRRCYIELSFDARQLKAIRRYIRLNPARALWKRRHPDRFIRFANTTPHISAQEMRRDPAAAHQFRANCLTVNDLAARLCEKAATLTAEA